MELISGGVERNDENGEKGILAIPRARIAADGFAQGAPEQEGEDGVFSQMGTFADDVHDAASGLFGHVRKEPVENGPDDARRMFIGGFITGSREDKAHPDDDGQPIEQKRARARHGATRNLFLWRKPMENWK